MTDRQTCDEDRIKSHQQMYACLSSTLFVGQDVTPDLTWICSAPHDMELIDHAWAPVCKAHKHMVWINAKMVGCSFSETESLPWLRQCVIGHHRIMTTSERHDKSHACVHSGLIRQTQGQSMPVTGTHTHFLCFEHSNCSLDIPILDQFSVWTNVV